MSYLLRFLDRIDRMKNSYRNVFFQSQSWIDFLTCGKSRFIQSENSCQNESVSSQTRSRCFWHLFNLHSQKFVEFLQVFSKICHKPQTKFALDKPIKRYIQEEQRKKTRKKTQWDARLACCTVREWKHNLIFVLPNEGWKSGGGWKISVSIK